MAEVIAKDRGIETTKKARRYRLMKGRMLSPETADTKQLAHGTLNKNEVRSLDRYVDAFNRAGAKQELRAEAYPSKSGAFLLL